VVEVHLVGAILAFFGLLIYGWLQTFISNALPDFLHATPKIFALRLFFCILGTLNLFIGMYIMLHHFFALKSGKIIVSIFVYQVVIFSKIANSKFNGSDRLLWQPTDGVILNTDFK
jgi:hypothetical protein